MSDKTQTLILRVICFGLLTGLAFTLTEAVDWLLSSLLKKSGYPIEHPRLIEEIAFTLLVIRAIWGWLKKRVWIGSEANP